MMSPETQQALSAIGYFIAIVIVQMILNLAANRTKLFGDKKATSITTSTDGVTETVDAKLTRLEKLIKDLTTERDALKSQVLGLETQVAALGTQLETKDSSLERVRDERDELRVQLESSQRQLTDSKEVIRQTVASNETLEKRVKDLEDQQRAQLSVESFAKDLATQFIAMMEKHTLPTDKAAKESDK